MCIINEIFCVSMCETKSTKRCDIRRYATSTAVPFISLSLQGCDCASNCYYDVATCTVI